MKKKITVGDKKGNQREEGKLVSPVLEENLQKIPKKEEKVRIRDSWGGPRGVRKNEGKRMKEGFVKVETEWAQSSSVLQFGGGGEIRTPKFGAGAGHKE